MKLIGLAGYAGSGKDTVAKMLIDDYGYTKVSFAGPLYEALYRLNPIIDAWNEDKYAGGHVDIETVQQAVDRDGWEQTKREVPEVRRLLQALGTEVGREMFGQDFWVNQALQTARKLQRVVITDVRFDNEIEAVLAEGGKVYRVVRPGYGPVNAHVSDNALNDEDPRYTAVLLNDGTVSDLYRQVVSVVLS